MLSEATSKLSRFLTSSQLGVVISALLSLGAVSVLFVAGFFYSLESQLRVLLDHNVVVQLAFEVGLRFSVAALIAKTSPYLMRILANTLLSLCLQIPLLLLGALRVPYSRDLYLLARKFTLRVDDLLTPGFFLQLAVFFLVFFFLSYPEEFVYRLSILVMIFAWTVPLMASLVIGRRQMELAADQFPGWTALVEGLSIRMMLKHIRPSELGLFFSLFLGVASYLAGQVEFMERSLAPHSVLVNGRDAYIVAATQSGIIYSKLLDGSEIGGVSGTKYVVHSFISYDGGLSIEGKYYADLYGDEAPIHGDILSDVSGPQ